MRMVLVVCNENKKLITLEFLPFYFLFFSPPPFLSFLLLVRQFVSPRVTGLALLFSIFFFSFPSPFPMLLSLKRSPHPIKTYILSSRFSALSRFPLFFPPSFLFLPPLFFLPFGRNCEDERKLNVKIFQENNSNFFRFSPFPPPFFSDERKRVEW